MKQWEPLFRSLNSSIIELKNGSSDLLWLLATVYIYLHVCTVHFITIMDTSLPCIGLVNGITWLCWEKQTKHSLFFFSFLLWPSACLFQTITVWADRNKFDTFILSYRENNTQASILITINHSSSNSHVNRSVSLYKYYLLTHRVFYFRFFFLSFCNESNAVAVCTLHGIG